MNIHSIIAFTLAIFVFGVGSLTATKNPMAFLDWHAALIVFGGTLAVAAISFQMDRILILLKIFYYRILRGKKTDFQPVINDLVELSEAYRANDPKLPEKVQNTKDPYLKEAMELVLDNYMTQEEVYETLNIRLNTMYSRYVDDAKKFKALGKFPPAMGLMGAVIGMIAILQKMGQEGAEKEIGPGMAVAMVATLYGIALSNLLILPVAENLTDGAKEMYVKNKIILKGIMLMMEKKNRILFTEELNSYLLPGERLNWKKIQNDKAA